jgi:hypothetical protein
MTERSVHHRPKTLGEGGVCLATVIGLLLAVALVLQWALHLLP